MTRRAKLVIAFWVLFVGGLLVRSISGPPTDNVTHHSAVCASIHWDTAQARYVNTYVTKGGGCKW